MQNVKEKQICRLLDANANRAKEALRVCEDIARFIFDNRHATQQYKAMRHQITALFQHPFFRKNKLLCARDTDGDIGRTSSKSELRRKDVHDIFYANSQRAKESVRVLEEFAKLIDKQSAKNFKKSRYRIYSLEREIAEKF